MSYELSQTEAWKIIMHYKRHTTKWHYKIIFWIQLETARRISEIVRLKLSDFGIDLRSVSIQLDKKRDTYACRSGAKIL